MDRFCQRNNVSTVQDAVTKLYRCVVEIKKGSGSRGSEGAAMSPPHVAEINMKAVFENGWVWSDQESWK